MTLGPLILAGGAEFDERMDDADRAWLAGRQIGLPRVGVFPTANMERPDRAAANGATHFRRLATHAEAVMVTTTATAADGRILDQIGKLDFAYFAGGEPMYLAQTLAGSIVWAALAGRWRDAMGLGGSSAGAMALCQAIYLRDQWAEGLGLIQGAVTMPHFNRRDAASAERARRAVVERGLIGLGIDESTALVWTAEAGWRVAGPGRVTLLAASGMTAYGHGDTADGVPPPGP